MVRLSNWPMGNARITTLLFDYGLIDYWLCIECFISITMWTALQVSSSQQPKALCYPHFSDEEMDHRTLWA